jgi:hypothetical protein
MNSFISEKSDHDDLPEGYVSLAHSHDAPATGYVTHDGHDIPAGRYESNDHESSRRAHRDDAQILD